MSSTANLQETIRAAMVFGRDLCENISLLIKMRSDVGEVSFTEEQIVAANTFLANSKMAHDLGWYA